MTGKPNFGCPSSGPRRVLLGVACVALTSAGCGGSSTSLPNACSLLRTTDVVQTLGVRIEGSSSLGDPQECLYGAGLPTADSVILTVSKGSKARTSVPGSPIRNPVFFPIPLDNLTAYWSPTPEEDLGLATPQPHGGGYLSVVKDGDLVRLYLQGAGNAQQAQAVRLMRTVLSRM